MSADVEAVEAAPVEVPKDLQERAAGVVVPAYEAVPLDTLIERVNLLKELMKRCMVEGQHHGTIPGTKKPSLWKPGAELICTLFQLGARYPKNSMLIERENGHFLFTLTCELFHIPTGRVVGEGVGAGSTMEYRFRIQTEDRYSDHGQPIKAKYTPFDFYNTVLKMAKKRCLGSTTPVLVKTRGGLLRTNLSKMHDIWERGGETLLLPGTDGTWRRVEGMCREDNRPVFRIEVSDGSALRATAEHRFPTERGLLRVRELQPGDRLIRNDLSFCLKPEGACNPEYGWLAGVFVADGHLDGPSTAFTLHREKKARIAERLVRIAKGLAATTSVSHHENTLRLAICGPAFRGMIDQFVAGTGSHQRHASRHVWRQGREFLQGFLDGYLACDGHLVTRPGRATHWMVGFSRRNTELAFDLRSICAALGYRINLTFGTSQCEGKTFHTHEGWIKTPVESYNQKHLSEITAIVEEAKPAVVYDVQVDGNHLFCLADGIQTHNSFVDAVLTASGASEIWTQDTEDNPELYQEQSQQSVRQSLPKPPPGSPRLKPKSKTNGNQGKPELVTGVVERAWPNDFEGTRYFMLKLKDGRQVQTKDPELGATLLGCEPGEDFRAHCEPSSKPSKLYLVSFSTAATKA
jgi:hypothetical protein